MKFALFVDAAVNPTTGVTAVAFVRVSEDGKVTTRAAITKKRNSSIRAELYAIVYALRAVSALYQHDSHDITIYSDCLTVVQAATYRKHKHNGDLWVQFNLERRVHNIDLRWIRRNMHPYSELAHNLALNTLRKHLHKRN